MNFYGHAFVATRFRSTPGFVFGAMLPDFEGMAHVRVTGIDDAEIRDGVACHHAVDSAFHGAPEFVGSCARSVEMMTARGLARGPARAIAHVGLELVLDAFIVETHGDLPEYEDALAEGERRLETMTFRGADETASMRLLLSRLRAYGPPSARSDARVIAERLVRMLQDRPRLAVPTTHVHEVVHHVEHLIDAIPTLGPMLVDAASTLRERA